MENFRTKSSTWREREKEWEGAGGSEEYSHTYNIIYRRKKVSVHEYEGVLDGWKPAVPYHSGTLFTRPTP